MIITSDVKDSFGRTLLNGGQQLQNRHIEILKSYHIDEILVNGLETNDISDVKEFDTEVYHSAVQEMESIFILTDRSWDVMKEIHHCAVLSKTRRPSTIERS